MSISNNFYIRIVPFGPYFRVCLGSRLWSSESGLQFSEEKRTFSDQSQFGYLKLKSKIYTIYACLYTVQWGEMLRCIVLLRQTFVFPDFVVE